jgi:hypothetical protein
MKPALVILLIAIGGSLLAHRRQPGLLLKIVLALELAAAIFLILQSFRPADISKPYQKVFRAGGYGLGRLLVESGRSPGLVVLLQTGNGNVDEWRRQGFEDALEGSGYRLARTAVVPMDLQSGCLLREPFVAELEKCGDGVYAAAFAGLPDVPNLKTDIFFVAFHPSHTDGMKSWWKSGQLLGVISPRMGDAPSPSGKEKLAGLADSFFNSRHSGEGL